jgi:uncharacterized protein DUF2878
MAARLAFCFVLGACVGTLLDGIHAYGDVLEYPNPAFGRWAWFVPLEFGLVGLAAGLAVPTLERLAGDPGIDWSLARRIAELFLFACLYVSTTLVHDLGAVLLAIALGALAAVRLVRREVPGDWIYVLPAAVLGPAAEAALSALGVFDYKEPDIAGVPVWLPSLWANGGFLIRRLVAPIVLRPARRRDADRS